MKAKKVIKKIFVSLLILLLVVLICAGGFFALYRPTVSFDAENLTGEVTNGASGFLYGIAEEGVPSENMVKSIDLSTLATKTTLGLQHPIGEMGDVAGEAVGAGECEYLIVYLQDMYSTWYYDYESITEMKRNGEYDWQAYLTETYFPLVKQTVEEIKKSDYHDKIVYCLFNECDNGIWFGEWVADENNPDGGRSDFNEAGRSNFNNAWLMTYNYVKSLDPSAKIGGPGNYEYSSEKMENFLKFTCENGCTPDVMIYHELGDRSVYDWQANVSALREIEKKYSISEKTPIIVSEYGRMQDNGNPNTMLKYITQIEASKVYGDQAYWLLANNLCSTAADYNTPNSAWWVYRWYADMQGETMNSEISDIFHSDFEKALKEKREFRYQQFMGLGSLSENKIDILISGADYDGVVKIKNLEGTPLYKQKVNIKITCVEYEGILGAVFAPQTVKEYTDNCSKTLKINMNGMNSNSAYHIEITPASQNEAEFENENLYKRYEFEAGTLLGGAYTYDSAYATTGELNGMVGGFENDGDGVTVKIDVPDDGAYELKLIYGNSNDGAYDENGRQSPDGRTDSTAILTIDGEQSEIAFENTVKSEITNSIVITRELEDGDHTITLEHKNGTFVLDSMLVRKAENGNEITVLTESGEDTPVFIAIADNDGYYELETQANSVFDADGAEVAADNQGKAIVYLRRGLNYIKAPDKSVQTLIARRAEKAVSPITLNPRDAELSGTAELGHNALRNIDFISGIASDGGSALYNVNVPESGVYKLTVTYSNNEENGVHAYNVDLVEEFITVSVNGSVQKELYCRNTYSRDNFTTVTTCIELEAGDNALLLYNDGFNRFNGGKTTAPDIARITVNSPQVY